MVCFSQHSTKITTGNPGTKKKEVTIHPFKTSDDRRRFAQLALKNSTITLNNLAENSFQRTGILVHESQFTGASHQQAGTNKNNPNLSSK